MSADPIRLVLSDVDGTLVTSEKLLSARAVRAVQRLGDAGILFAITSARPPRGLATFVAPLDLSTPLGAYNGGLIVDPHMRVLLERTIRDDLAAPIIDVLTSHDLSVWVYRDADWLVLDAHGPHVQHEAHGTGVQPTRVATFQGISQGVAKVVGVSDDLAASAAARAVVHETFAGDVEASYSQQYYLDITHPDANKGAVVAFLSSRYDLDPHEIATIGDMHNDVAMFEASGLSIAMGNALDEVQRAAHHVTSSNDEEGFARAIEEFILAR